MYYYVIGADGSRFGPAEVSTLVRWVAEGRIIGSTLLIERGTDRQIPAEDIPALAAAIAQASQGTLSLGPIGSFDDAASAAPPYTEPVESSAGRNFNDPRRDQSSSVQAVPVARLGHPAPTVMGEPKKRIVAGLLGILFGGVGLHRFYLGYTGIGLLMLLLSLGGTIFTGASVPPCACGIVWFWGFIEGLLCLCGGMRDAKGRDLVV